MRLVLSERSPLSLLPKRARFVLGSHLARIEGIKRTACPTRAKRGMTNPETASPFFMSQVQASDLIPHHRTIVVGDTLLGSSPHPGILGVGWLEGVTDLDIVPEQDEGTPYFQWDGRDICFWIGVVRCVRRPARASHRDSGRVSRHAVH